MDYKTSGTVITTLDTIREWVDGNGFIEDVHYDDQHIVELIDQTILDVEEDETIAQMVTALRTVAKDCQMALDGEWDKSDAGFQDTLDMVESAIEKTLAYANIK